MAVKTRHHCSNMGTWRVSVAGRLRRRRVAPMTARTDIEEIALRGMKTRWVFERRSGGLIRNPSEVFCVRSLGIMPSMVSLSLNFNRTQRPSVRGRVVKVLRVRSSESPIPARSKRP